MAAAVRAGPGFLRHWRHLLCALFGICCQSAVAQTCLGAWSTYTTPESRQNLVIQDGTRPDIEVPLGIFNIDLTSSLFISEIFKILVEEKLGINTVYTDASDVSMAAVYALAGCHNPTAGPPAEDAGCAAQFQESTATAVRSHIAFEVWDAQYEDTLANFSNRFTDIFPERLGLVGYTGKETLFVPSQAISAAYYRNGTTLEVYRAFNLTWNAEFDRRPWEHFTNIQDIPTSSLKPCDTPGTTFNDRTEMDRYARLFSDGVGVVDSVARCWDSTWWLSPGCRAPGTDYVPSPQCIPVITGGNGWAADEFMQKAAQYDMPLAIAIASDRNTYASLPRDYSVIMYWWHPDQTFIDMAPSPMAFPDFDQDEWNRGVKRSAKNIQLLSKWAYNDLQAVSPHTYQLARLVTLSDDTMESLLLERQVTSESINAIACRWMLAYPEAWQGWIPDESRCLLGYGLVTEDSGDYITTRDLGATCRWCDPGRFSEKYRDERGSTYICSQCPPGTSQKFTGRRNCEECASGRYNPVSGLATDCAKCPTGADCGSAEGTEMFVSLAGFYVFQGEDSQRLLLEEFVARQNSSNLDSLMGFSRVGPFQCLAGEDACFGNNTCAGMMRGPLCSACAPLFQHESASDLCVACPSMAQNIVMSLGSGLVLIAGVALLDRVSAGNVGSSHVRGMSSVVVKVLNNFLTLLSVISTNIGLKQVLERFAENSPIASLGTLPLLSSMMAGGMAQDPQAALVSAHCLFQSFGSDAIVPEYAIVVYGWLVVPVILAIALALVAIVGGCYRRNSHNIQPGGMSEMIITNFQPMAVLLVYFTHPMVTTKLLSVWDCRQEDLITGLKLDTRRMTLNSMIMCDEDTHVTWMMIAAGGLLVWSFGVPLLFYFVLRRMNNEQKLQSQSCVRKYGFLYNGYQSQHFYYESIFMCRRVVYLVCANAPGLPADSRVVLMLCLNFLFLAMHLRVQPFDDRAYFGLDRAETLSSYTLIMLLLGSLFQKSLQRNASYSHTEMVFIPAIAASFGTVFYTGYLFCRSSIWPLDQPPHLLPKIMKTYFDKRAYVSLIPPEPDKPPLPHGALEFARAEVLNTFLKERGGTHMKTLPGPERRLLKTICADIVEIALRRHELCTGEAPDVVCLQTLCVQLERIMVCCVCTAVKERIKQKLSIKSNHVRSWTDYVLHAVVSFVTLLVGTNNHAEREVVQWGNLDDDTLCGMLDLIQQPVSLEELHVALMVFTPQLLDEKNKDQNFIRRYAKDHQGIIDQFSNVTSLFDMKMHQARLDKGCVAKAEPEPVEEAAPTTGVSFSAPESPPPETEVPPSNEGPPPKSQDPANGAGASQLGALETVRAERHELTKEAEKVEKEVEERQRQVEQLNARLKELKEKHPELANSAPQAADPAPDAPPEQGLQTNGSQGGGPPVDETTPPSSAKPQTAVERRMAAAQRAKQA